MAFFIQVVTIVIIIALTYVVFQAFGDRRANLLFTTGDRARWSHVLNTRLGSWFTGSNIIGTLTSVATVYLFFLGNAKRFGGWIFICSLAIWLGGYITNYITTRICRDPNVQAIMSTPDQVGGVIASIFWQPTYKGHLMAATVKWISLANIGAILWLDFALFIRVSLQLLTVKTLLATVGLGFAICFSVVYFTLRYGLRGFVFADLFQVPLIAIATLVLFLGCIFIVRSSRYTIVQSTTFMSPTLPESMWLPFIFHVVFLNLFMVVVTEPHWLRYWFFRSKETDLQTKSTAATAVLWILIMAVGLCASLATGNSRGDSTIADILGRLTEISPIFLSAFWAGAVAALFSSADSQVYSFLIVNQFNVHNGKLVDRTMTSIRPGLVSILIAIAFTASYAIVELLGIPFEKVIFVIIPASLNILPAFVLLIRGRIVDPRWVWVSSLVYIGVACFGLLQSSQEYKWTLMAALVPLAISIAAFGVPLRLKEETTYVEAR